MFHLNDIVFVKSLFVHIANNQVMQTSCQCYFRLLHFSPLQKQGNHNVQNCNLFWSMSSWLFRTTMWMSNRNIKLLHWALPWILSCLFCSIIFTCIFFMNWLSLNEIMHFENTYLKLSNNWGLCERKVTLCNSCFSANKSLALYSINH